MHLLAAQPGEVSDGSEPVDPAQDPADVVFLSAADTELAALAAARATIDAPPSLRLAHLNWLAHPYSVDLYLDRTAAKSRLVVARILGGAAYWRYGVEQFAARLHEAGIPFAALPGDDKPDEELRRLSTVPDDDWETLWSYCVEGGPENAANLLRLTRTILDGAERPEAPRPLLRAGRYPAPAPRPGAPTAAIVVYRALLQGGGLAPLDALVEALHARGLNPLPVFAASLKDPVSASTLEAIFADDPPDIIVNCTSFAVGSPEGGSTGTVLDRTGAPVLQAVLSASSESAWSASPRGLSARDIAMNVALPEVDGRILSRAIGFKGEAWRDEATQCPIAAYRALPDRVAFVADLAANWARLRRTPAPDRRLALILANYPNKDGRLANGVGLDTPAATVHVLETLRAAGYAVEDIPADSDALMQAILAGPTNWLTDRARRTGGVRLPLSAYRAAWARLPQAVRDQVEARWGPPESDPFLIHPQDPVPEAAPAPDATPPSADPQAPPPEAPGAPALSGDPTAPAPDAFPQSADPQAPPPETPGASALSGDPAAPALDASPPSADPQAPAPEAPGAPAPSESPAAPPEPAFALSILRFGAAVVGVQPARGYNIDPEATYHAPDLVPPHNYLAFYIWLRDHHRAHALIHMGKHGNLEWLPGKATALSESCFPEAALGPLPHLYPFIVNDPGEGTQAKRRAQAVIVDHLTPPLTRAETYGELRRLEVLVDEYYEAAGVDPRRIAHLRDEILSLMQATGLDLDAGAAEGDDADSRLQKLDAYLCELKESQIRDGLHIFGQSPTGRLARDLTVALARVPRGAGQGGDASLIRALATDLALPREFDPLDCDMAAPWPGPRPEALALTDDPWRIAGDTVERLELLAAALVEALPDPASPAAASPPPPRTTAAPAATTDGSPLRVQEPYPAEAPAASSTPPPPPSPVADPETPPPASREGRASAASPALSNGAPGPHDAAPPPAASVADPEGPPPASREGDAASAPRNGVPRPDAAPETVPSVSARDHTAAARSDSAADPAVPAAAPGPRPTAPGPASAAVLAEIAARIRPAVAASGPVELHGLLTALDGRFLAPGPSGAPTRGRLDVLPTGRNFYSVDSRSVPTRTAWALGWRSACLLIERHAQDHGDWPRSMALTAWGTANMRTGGDDIAQALALMGVRPQWDDASRRVTGFEIIPLTALGRPRVDVTLRVSGFFRDAFPAQMDLVASAAAAVMRLPEPEADNPSAARFRTESTQIGEARASRRVFGSKPGAYGAGLQAMIDERLWRSREDLAEAWLQWGAYAYGAGEEGAAARDDLETRLRQTEAVVHNQDNREHDLLDSDDYYQFEGGLSATVEHLRGQAPTVYHNDHSRPERPVIRTLDEEIGRVIRSRVVNPKWIEGVKRHGYKGAFEIAATVDYLFAFAATTHAVRDHHFDLVHAAFLEDDDTRDFIDRHNPAALREIAERLSEAIDRGLWRPRSNSARARLDALKAPA